LVFLIILIIKFWLFKASRKHKRQPARSGCV